jgi:hypothetical protein
LHVQGSDGLVKNRKPITAKNVIDASARFAARATQAFEPVAIAA